MCDCVMEEDSRMLLNADKIRYLSIMHQLQSPRIAEHDIHGGVKQVMLDGPKRKKRPQGDRLACSVMLLLL